MLDKKHWIFTFMRQKIALLNKDTPYSRAMLAKLRRAVGKPPGMVPDIWEITVQGLPEEARSRDGKPTAGEDAVHTALTLYALQHRGKDQNILGHKESFAKAAARLIQKDEIKKDAIKRRFDAIATSVEFTELAHHARGMVRLFMANDNICLDYPAFAYDLYLYRLPGGADRVRLRWGEEFYEMNDKGNL